MDGRTAAAAGAEVMRRDTNMLFVRVGEARQPPGGICRERGVPDQRPRPSLRATHIDVNHPWLCRRVSQTF